MYLILKLDNTLIPLREGEEYVIPKEGVYSEMLKMMDSNRISGDNIGVAKRITFKLPQANKKEEMENLKDKQVESIKPNLRTIKAPVSFGESLKGSFTLDS